MSDKEINIMYANYKSLIQQHLSTAKNLIDQVVALQNAMQEDCSSKDWLEPIIDRLLSNIKNLLGETRQLFHAYDTLIASY